MTELAYNMTAQARNKLGHHHAIFVWTFATMHGIAPRLTVLMLVTSFLSGVTPVILFLAIRGLIDGHRSLSLSGTSSLDALTPWLVAVFIVAMIEALVSQASKLIASQLLARANLELTSRVLVKAARQPVSYFELRQNQNEIEQLQSNIASRMTQLLERSLLILTSSLQILTLTAILIFIEPAILLVVIPLSLPYLYFQLKLGSARYVEDKSAAESRRRIGYYVSLMTSAVSAAEVRLLGLAPHFVSRFRSNLSQLDKVNHRRQVKDFSGSMLFSMLAVMGLFLVFSRVVDSMLVGEATIGDIVIFAVAMIRLRNSIELLARSASLAIEQISGIVALKNFLELPDENQAPNKDHQNLFEPLINFEDVSFRYPGAEDYALQGLSLQINPGETVAIVGENGSGKSTLVKLLAGFYQDYEGRITINKTSIGDFSSDTLRDNIAFVFQDFGRYAATAQENIAFGDWQRLGNNPDAVAEVASATSLDETIMGMPNGYSTMLGRSFGDYDPSGGTWQKIAIARAFARDASLLIMDEPTAAVDARAEFMLFQQLAKLAVGKTTLLISHRFSTVSMANRILVMDKGKIVEQGSHNELLAMNGLYAELYGYYLRRMNLE